MSLTFNADAATPKLVGLNEAPTANADLNDDALGLAMANPIPTSKGNHANGQSSGTSFPQLGNIQFNSCLQQKHDKSNLSYQNKCLWIGDKVCKGWAHEKARKDLSNEGWHTKTGG